MTKTALAIRHVAFEDLGTFAPVLAERGYDVSYREAGIDDLGAAELAAADLLVVLGGPIGATDDADYPWLTDETRVVEARLAAGRPTLGICLGAQIMARALGARVYPGSAKEIGWAPIALSEQGAASCLRHMAPERTPVLHWHGDTFDLPAGTERLASTDVCENQAFALGASALALQFHAEVEAKALEKWYVGHAMEIAATPGVTVAGLRADSARFGAGFETQGATVIGEWLDGLGG